MEVSSLKKLEQMEFSLDSVTDLSSPSVSSSSPAVATFSCVSGVTELRFLQSDSAHCFNFDLASVQLFKLGPVQYICVSDNSGSSEEKSFSKGVNIKFRNEKDSKDFSDSFEEWRKDAVVQGSSVENGRVSTNKSKFDDKIEASSAKMYFHYYGQLLHQQNMLQDYTLLTICEGHDGTETSNGDVLIFPDMIRYRRLTHFDVDTFVEEVLVKDVKWLPGNPESLNGSYVFVCCHGSRDQRCGVCGPSLVSRFREEIELCGLQAEVSVSPCSHIGGHKYTGDVIIYGLNVNQRVTGHWYGCVTLEDVPLLLEQHINKGEIVDRLWRGEMGLLKEEQKKTQEQRFQLNSEKINNGEVNQESVNNGFRELNGNCCNQNGNSSCCVEENHKQNLSSEREISGKNASFRISSSENGSSCGVKVCGAMSMWLESWEKEDTYAALAVACAAASVAIAFNCYKQLK